MGDIIPALQKGKLKPYEAGYVTSVIQMMSGGSVILPQAYHRPNLHSISRLIPKRNSRRDYVFGTVKVAPRKAKWIQILFMRTGSLFTKQSWPFKLPQH